LISAYFLAFKSHNREEGNENPFTLKSNGSSRGECDQSILYVLYGNITVKCLCIINAHQLKREKKKARYWWLTPVILTTQEAKIRSQPGQIVCETYLVKTCHKTQKRDGGVTQG
jgi:hypothetical protein